MFIALLPSLLLSIVLSIVLTVVLNLVLHLMLAPSLLIGGILFLGAFFLVSALVPR